MMTARSKGLKEQVVVLRHVLRNSLIPVVTLVALGVPAVFGGAIVTEQIFRVPGIGELLVRSIGDGDTPVVAAILLIFAVLVVLFNLVADVMYAVLDPRIRYS
jgi:peptide/nickel transport system permease protein